MPSGFIGRGKTGGNMALRQTISSTDGSVKGGHTVAPEIAASFFARFASRDP